MTHARWHSAIRRILSVADGQPEQALVLLQRLFQRLEDDAARQAGEWHIEQTLELISSVQSHLGKHREAAETMLRIAKHHEGQQTYYRRGVVAACATATLEFAAAGNRPAALAALQRGKRLASGLRPQEKLYRQAERAVQAMPHRRKRSKV